MSKLDAKVDLYVKNLKEKIGVKTVNRDLLRAVSKGLGPNIYKSDASKVSSSNKDEMDRIKKNFLIKKLGLKDGVRLDNAIAAVIDQMGKSNRTKYRAVFYYLLVKQLRQGKQFK